MEAKRVRTLIVDDNAEIRRLIHTVLGFEDDFEVVGEASDSDEAIRVAEQIQPDLVLLDVMMPGRPGDEALPDIRAAAPRARVIFLTGLGSGMSGEIDDVVPIENRDLADARLSKSIFATGRAVGELRKVLGR